MASPGEHVVHYAVNDLACGQVASLPQAFPEALFTVFRSRIVFRLGHPVGERNQHIATFQGQRARSVGCVLKNPDYHPVDFERDGCAVTDQQRRQVASVRVCQRSGRGVIGPEEERRVLLRCGVYD